MGEQGLWVIIVTMIFSGISSVAFCVATEKTWIKASDVISEHGICKYPKSPAIILACIAACFIFITQILITVLAHSIRRARNNTSNTQSSPRSRIATGAYLSFILSWVCAIVGIAFLASAVIRSNRREFLPLKGRCYTVLPIIYSMGEPMSILAYILGQLSIYILWSLSNSAS